MDNQTIDKKQAIRDKSYIFFKYIISITMIFMVVVIFINACMRYIFNYGFAASEELGRFAFVWISFLGMVIAYFQNKHVGVDYLAVLFKGGKRLVFDLITDSIIFVTLIAMLYGSYQYYLKTWFLKSPATNVSYGYIYIAAIFAAILMIFKLFSNAKKQILEYKRYRLERGDE